MTNKEIGNKFQELAQLMEFHGENPFKIRTYQNVYATLRKLNEEVGSLSLEALKNIKGIGEAVAAKIRELEDTGEMRTLRKYEDQTPAGIREMLTIRGLGPKKIRTLYDQLEIESVGELRYAILENRLLELPGFGVKTQEDILAKLIYFQEAKGLFRLATFDVVAKRLEANLKSAIPGGQFVFTGDYRRRMPVLSGISFMCSPDDFEALREQADTLFNKWSESKGVLDALYDEIYPVKFIQTTLDIWITELVRTTGGSIWQHRSMPSGTWDSEDALFDAAGLPFLPPECRDLDESSALKFDPETIIDKQHIRGMIHLHTTFSDGINTLEEMAKAAADGGFEYLVVTDHSKSAVYANGLTIERLEEQWQAIDRWNNTNSLVVLKGIECDILVDGSMDYSDEVMAQFDVVIASVHAQLKMDEDRATQRFIRAIEHPSVHILGHPTGRLLLSRSGYPVNHAKLIDACAANQVSIELNANPFRLDLDWSFIPYARDKGVLISINPDAHNVRGYSDLDYGIMAARKGGLSHYECLNALPVEKFLSYIHQK